MKSVKEIIQGKTNEELKHMVENPSAYQEDFSIEAFKELNSRNVEFNVEKIQKIIDTRENIIQKISEEKQKQEFINKIRPPIFNVISAFILGAILLRILKMYFVETNIKIGAIEIPYLPDVINIFFLILLLYLFGKGMFQIRIVYLIGFLINTSIGIFYMAELHLSILDIAIYSSHILFKFITLVLLFSKPVNHWMKLVHTKNETKKEVSNAL